MTEPALKAEIWVKAQIRICDSQSIPCFVVRKGDPDAGSILLKLNRLGAGVDVYSQVRTMDGIRAWMRATGDEPVDELKADEYIEKQLKFDPDIWVLEIEDPGHNYIMDGKVI
jgi:hypothetical protein